ncbi:MULTISPECIES: alpha-L-rhamnosidase [unclassified Microbacterium]|uniref:alpha-L-rhamnosidase n=1 Tax=unclassified Microbacterium TaxID=2609290 RepID=UPI00160558E9|nr:MULTISPECIES: alpha-L-rhamnosidase [unclassified Microbacterium]QNA93974.1 family 78 glycoside hydrolase catalytic domain [Microbacterium sp. Se63.02b]QYM64299.1 glycoside hydrolase family 78 protein [Microbacterium sp. Se5.02b]
MTRTPSLGWKITSDTPNWHQTGAEIELSLAGLVRRYEIDGPTSVAVHWPFDPLPEMAEFSVRVRVSGPDGQWSSWSAPVSQRCGVMSRCEWRAPFLGHPKPTARAMPFTLRGLVRIEPGLRSATAFATALGAYSIELNGREIDDAVLKPGWTPFRERVDYHTADIGPMISIGTNVLLATVAGGWFTENLGDPQAPRPYGEQPAVSLQIHLQYADRIEVIVADETWRVAPQTPIVSSSIYNGERWDDRLHRREWNEADFDDAAWPRARSVEWKPEPGPAQSPRIRRYETMPVSRVLRSVSGKTILDFGQNLVGWVVVQKPAVRGARVSLRHAEVLEQGELSTRPLRKAQATDEIVLDGRGGTWEPKFTFHGFRYVEVEGWPGELDPADIAAQVVHTAMERTGHFESSSPELNRLHENIVWSMRGNFLGVPSDCPQRDERLGWTGDIQVFSPVATFLFDCEQFLRSWLTDLATEQRQQSGSVPLVVPNVLLDARWLHPTAGWGDAATVVPAELYARFGDVGVLQSQFDSMTDWVDVVRSRLTPSSIWEDKEQLGDWLDPHAPPDRPELSTTEHALVATAYAFRSARLLADAATALGMREASARASELATTVRGAWAERFVRADGSLTSESQTAYALAIEFRLLESHEERSVLGDHLRRLVEKDDHRIGTGFLGTPVVLRALSATGHLETAEQLLFQTEPPSWLYAVRMGATTIWERWDSLLPDGSVNPGEMTSFNHYALGAVADWMHGDLAGIRPLTPGYKKIGVTPLPIESLSWCRASVETPYGTVATGWERDGLSLDYWATVPPNTTAIITLPGAEGFEVGSGDHRWQISP